MYFVALATDYDGTIAEDGVVAEATLEALRELKQSGRKLLLVTGRQLPDLKKVLPEIALFDLVVAENGGLLFDPKTGEETLLAPEPSQVFLDALRAREVPLSAGRCIVATWEPHQHAVLEAIRELGLELQIIFNKGAVMVLPAGVSKASGLEAALALLELSPHNVGPVTIRKDRNDVGVSGYGSKIVAVAAAAIEDELSRGWCPSESIITPSILRTDSLASIRYSRIAFRHLNSKKSALKEHQTTTLQTWFMLLEI
jgi:hydroxymethylpyrimidine pyrophosphatase-like HAD family hydrolase